MTDEELKKLKAQIREAMAADRHGVLMRFPFIGNLLMRMDLIPVRDRRCRTACTDGRKIFFDMDFYMKLKDSERLFVLAHEISHCMLLHLVRCQSRDQQLFNMASDMEVNYMLATQPNKHDIQPPKDVLWPDDCMKGKSAEVIYEYLLKKLKKTSNSQSFKLKKSGMNGNSSDGADADDNDEESYEAQRQYGNDSDRNRGGKTPNGKDTGKLEGQFDGHNYGGNTPDSQSDAEGGGSGDGKVTDQWGEVGYDSEFTPKVSDDFAEEMREAVIAEAQRTERTKGDMPAGLDAILKELQKPEMPWSELLNQYITQCFGDKRRWLPPSRRHVYNEIYLQSRRDEKIKVGCLVDTSGSCWGDLAKFFGELSGLLNSFGNYELYVIQCDADVHKVDHYDSANPFPVGDPKSIDIEGCGGSDFKPAFKYIREKALEFDCLVGFTDGFIDTPTYDPGYPVIWVLTSDGNMDFCSWGQKLKFKHASYEDASALSC